MKKTIALIVILLLVANTVFASEYYPLILSGGATCLVGGIALILVGNMDEPNVGMLIGGGLLSAVGLGLFIWGIVDGLDLAQEESDDDLRLVRDNPILKHTAVGVGDNRVYVGAQFSF